MILQTIMLAVLLQAPTIEQLASVLRGDFSESLAFARGTTGLMMIQVLLAARAGKQI